MSQTQIQEYPDTPAARVELLAFLKRTGLPPAGTCSWEARLKHWWDENPHAAQHPLRGYIVRHGERLVGFAGAIPTSHSLNGQRVASISATTLRADPEFNRGGVQMLMKMRGIGRQVMVTHTTPIPKLRELLTHMGARAEITVMRHLFPTGFFARLSGRHDHWPKLDGGLRLTTCLDEVKSIAPLSRTSAGLEKWICLDSLRWQVRTPMYAFHFMGAVDQAGALHAFLILKNRPRTFRLFNAWEVMEAWSAHDGSELTQALLGCLVRSPRLLGQRRHWLTTTAFAGDTTWATATSLAARQESVCHFFMLPESLRAEVKHTVMAEGDLVL